jgi:PEGA domain-containing protein
MAPEQGKGAAVDGRADQYSLGVVGYRMITAELPFSGDSVHTIIYKHIYEAPPLASVKRPGIPGTLTMAISRALSKDPEQRFATMEEFATAVWPEQPVAAPGKGRGAARPRSRAAADAPTEITGAPTTPLPGVKAGKPPAPRPLPRAARKSRVPVLIGLAAVAAAGVGGYLLVARTGTPERSTADRPAPAPVVDTVRIQDTVRVPAQAAPPPRQRPRPTSRAAQRAAAPAVEEQGSLTVAADPFGEVFVDGVDAGQTPLIEYAVKPGRHTIRIERPGFKTVTEAVQVDANNTVRKRYTLLPE